MAELIKASGERVAVEPNNKKKFTLEELQGFVGGYIEAVYLPDKQVMVCNEEGKLHNLPLNMGASMIANQTIAGDVLLCLRREM